MHLGPEYLQEFRMPLEIRSSELRTTNHITAYQIFFTPLLLQEILRRRYVRASVILRVYHNEDTMPTETSPDKTGPKKKERKRSNYVRRQMINKRERASQLLVLLVIPRSRDLMRASFFFHKA